MTHEEIQRQLIRQLAPSLGDSLKYANLAPHHRYLLENMLRHAEDCESSAEHTVLFYDVAVMVLERLRAIGAEPVSIADSLDAAKEQTERTWIRMNYRPMESGINDKFNESQEIYDRVRSFNETQANKTKER